MFDLQKALENGYVYFGNEKLVDFRSSHLCNEIFQAEISNTNLTLQILSTGYVLNSAFFNEKVIRVTNEPPKKKVYFALFKQNEKSRVLEDKITSFPSFLSPYFTSRVLEDKKEIQISADKYGYEIIQWFEHEVDE